MTHKRRAFGAGVAAAVLLALTGLPSAAAADPAPSAPADGKVMLVMGQDSDTLSDYRRTCWTTRRSGHRIPVA
ncbi:hypothetical protein ACIBSR_23830 [Streptomyces sp. NPDC049936]|uniref:hypothetical protein n=1 Tax=Streptomyces sp. NPDC049936 TaxID=3365599 RepID=UPI0037977887